MNPLKLTLRNAVTFDDITIDLPEGLLAVLGANGAGKSTLINAIDVALFGAQGRSLAEWVPRDGADDVLVIELMFEHAGETYRVRRSYNPKGRGQSKVDLERVTAGDWEEGPMGLMPDANGAILPSRQAVWEPLTVESAAATQTLIEDLVGLSRDTFRASSFLAQGEAGVFCEAPPRERKRILAEILGLAEWEQWLERAREQKRGSETELARIAGALERAEEELAGRETVEAELAVAEEALLGARGSLASATFLLRDARAKHAEAVARQSARREASEAVTRAQSALRTLEERIGSSEAEADMLRARLGDREALAEVAARFEECDAKRDQYVQETRDWNRREEAAELLEATKRALLVQQASAGAARKKAEEVLDGVGTARCDHCNQLLDQEAAEHAAAAFRTVAYQHDTDAKELLERIPALQEALDGLPAEKPDLLEAQRNIVALEEARRAREQLAALTEVEQRVSSIDAALEKMRVEVRSHETELGAVSRTAESLGPHNPSEVEDAYHKVAVLEHEEREHRMNVETLSGNVARHTATLERLDQIAADAVAGRARRDSLQADLDLYVALERACGPNGVPALILENVAIPQIETEATRILGDLGGPAHAVELHTLKQTKTAGVADTLDIVLLTDTGAAPYESFSGGERARIAFSLRLALAQLLANRKGAQTGLLVIDEIDGLDGDGVYALVRVLEELQRAVPRIILVSHQAELRDAFPQSIALVKDDAGVSRIVEREHALQPS